MEKRLKITITGERPVTGYKFYSIEREFNNEDELFEWWKQYREENWNHRNLTITGY